MNASGEGGGGNGVAILDYGSGNVPAIANVYRRAGIAHFMAREAHHLTKASGIVLPGVGAFDRTLEQLRRSGLLPMLERRVMEQRVPLLGICVGMQMLAESSEEGVNAGLGWIPGRVARFTRTGADGLPLPHMGWNQVNPTCDHPLMASLDMGREFYFLHSYHFECADSADILATACYGREFSAVVGRGNILGVQFHPEKSHDSGIRLLTNFAGLP